MELKSKLLLRETGQLTVYVDFKFPNFIECFLSTQDNCMRCIMVIFDKDNNYITNIALYL